VCARKYSYYYFHHYYFYCYYNYYHYYYIRLSQSPHSNHKECVDLSKAHI
jgi:hypothetical protein